jgi:hypothetical protein
VLAQTPRHRRRQARGGPRRVVTQLGEQERTGAKGALSRTWFQAALGQQRGLLVDDQPRHRSRNPENVCGADNLVASDDLGQLFVRQPEQAEQFLVPRGRVQ